MTNALTSHFLAVGAPEDNADVRFICRFSAPDPVVCLTSGKEHWIIVSDLEGDRARASVGAACKGLWTPTNLKLQGSDRNTVSRWVIEGLKRLGWKCITVSYNCPAGLVDTLRRHRIQVTIKNTPLLPQRAIKQNEELHHVRETQRVAVLAMRAAVSMIERATITRDHFLQSGRTLLTAEAVQRKIAEICLDHQCMCSEPIVAGGKASAKPHERGAGPLLAGQPIVIDIFPRHLIHGYWGDLTRTVIKGSCPQRVRRMAAAVRAAQRAALEQIRPGVQARTVHQAALHTLEDRGFKTVITPDRTEGFIHGTGHGVGLAIHEEPRIAGNRDRLRSGHVITVEPGLYYPDIGGIRIEDTIVVTRNGWRYLAPCEKRFEL